MKFIENLKKFLNKILEIVGKNSGTFWESSSSIIKNFNLISR